MPFQVGDRVELRSGRTARITRIPGGIVSPHLAQYEVALEPAGGQLPVKVSVVDIIRTLSPLAPLAAQAASGLGPFVRWPALNRAIHDVDLLFGAHRVVYAIQGSAAALIHGAVVSQAPADVDFLVANLADALRALGSSVPGVSATFTQVGQYMAVRKFRHASGPDTVDIDVAMGMEFGIDPAHRSAVQNVWVLTLAETLMSLLLRPERRRKEAEAFASLVVLKGGQLSPDDRERIRARLHADLPHGLKANAATWDGVTAFCRDQAATLALGLS